MAHVFHENLPEHNILEAEGGSVAEYKRRAGRWLLNQGDAAAEVLIRTTMSVLLLLVSILCLILVVLYLQFRWRHRHILATANKLPCPPAWPFIGNALFFVGDITSITKNIIKFTTQFKGLFSIWVGPVPVFVASDPSDVQIILNSSNTLEKDVVYHFLRPFIGNGLLTAPVVIWKKYRRLISPVLHPSNVEQYLSVFNDVSKDLVDKLASGTEEIEPTNDIFHTAVDAVMKIIGARNRLSSQTKENIIYLLDWGGKMFIGRLFKVWLHVDWIYYLLCGKEFKKAMKRYVACIDVLDQEWKNEENMRNLDPESNQNYGTEAFPGKSLLDVCFEFPPDGSEEHDWKDELMTMIVGATDTVVAALSFLLVTLANYPEVQTKIQAEIHEVIGDSRGDVTLSDLNSLTYLGHAIMESMRLHGIFPVIVRRATRDTKLSVCTLPAGSRILIPLHAMGWHENQFPHPEKFMPERFAPDMQQESGTKRHMYAFLPFSAGPRSCIGKTYAMMMMKTVMVHILRRFTVNTQVRMEDIEYELKVVMFSKTPLLLKFNPR
ncbi:cytochrome P450 4C1-like [Homalodisca vitripennis]|uniref:cytochrome P450 4C1-like n=1 Tax=Homalodisca vitripennis TaxID=197043 RepID=UPI001EEBE53E|nr:cytochrome P450 4C1-like [Homalodisca vitripennis]